MRRKTGGKGGGFCRTLQAMEGKGDESIEVMRESGSFFQTA